jgi:uncharacterized protein (TIGR02001 family)
MKKLLAMLALVATASAAQAEITGNLNLTSDYRFRGISQTKNGAAVQGGLDYAHKSGVYAGTWHSNVASEFYSSGSGIESDIYAGVKRSFGSVTVDVGAIRYMYANARTGADPASFNTTEVYAGATLGIFTAKVSQSTSDYFGTADSKGTRYYDLSAAVPVGRFTIVAHAGKTDVANQSTNDYKDYSLGISTEVVGLTVGAKYHVNDLTSAYETVNTVGGERLYKNAFVVSVSKSF